MTTPNKRSPAEAWRALEAKWAKDGGAGEAPSRAEFDAEVGRVAGLSDAEVDAELQAKGVDPEAVRAQGGAVDDRIAPAVPQVDPRPREPKAVPVRRLAPMWLIAAVFVLVCIGVALAIAGVFNGPKPEPIPEPRPVPTREVPPESRVAAAVRLRGEAQAACAKQDWTTCGQRIADAQDADPSMVDDPILKGLMAQVRQHEKGPGPGD